MLICSVLLFALQGIPQKYEALQFSPQCSLRCREMLQAPWFPMFASFPLRFLNGVDLDEYQLERNPNYEYYLCTELYVRNSTQRYRFSISSTIRSLATQIYRMPRTDYNIINTNTSNNIPITIGFKGPGEVRQRRQHPKKNELGEFEISIDIQSGRTVVFSQMQNIDYFELMPYQYRDCDTIARRNKSQNYKYIAAQRWGKKSIDKGVSVEPLFFDFVKKQQVIGTEEIVFMVTISIAGVVLIETIVFFSIYLKSAMKKRRRENAWVKHIDYMELQNKG